MYRSSRILIVFFSASKKKMPRLSFGRKRIICRQHVWVWKCGATVRWWWKCKKCDSKHMLMRAIVLGMRCGALWIQRGRGAYCTRCYYWPWRVVRNGNIKKAKRKTSSNNPRPRHEKGNASLRMGKLNTFPSSSPLVMKLFPTQKTKRKRTTKLNHRK